MTGCAAGLTAVKEPLREPAPRLGQPPAEVTKWLVDPASLGRYQEVRLGRDEGGFQWLDESHRRVRTYGGLELEVAREDQDAIWVKVFASELRQPTDRPAEAPVVTDTPPPVELLVVEQLELVAAGVGLPSSGQWRHGFAVADFDGDGRLDLALPPARKAYRPRPQIYLGAGGADFREWGAASFPDLPYDYGDLAAGDLDGDGELDLVIAAHLRGVVALRGDGHGEFAAWGSDLVLGEGVRFFSRAVELFDWDRDGRLDVLAFGEGLSAAFGTVPATGLGPRQGLVRQGLAVLRNAGNGGWDVLPAGRGGELDAGFGDGFALGDFDGDGYRDVALASHRPGSSSILGFGGAERGFLTAQLGSLPSGAFTSAVLASDFDRDGRDELVVGLRFRDALGAVWSGLDLYDLEPGSRTWSRQPLVAVPGQTGVWSLAAGDLDRDGRVDLVAGTGAGELWILLGNADGGFARELTPELPPALAGCRVYSLRLVDLEGSMPPEIVAGFAGEPTGGQGLGFSEPGCPDSGRMAVWRVIPRVPG